MSINTPALRQKISDVVHAELDYSVHGDAIEAAVAAVFVQLDLASADEPAPVDPGIRIPGAYPGAKITAEDLATGEITTRYMGTQDRDDVLTVCTGRVRLETRHHDFRTDTLTYVFKIDK